MASHITPMLLLCVAMQVFFGVFWLFAAGFRLARGAALLWAAAMFVGAAAMAAAGFRPHLDPQWGKLLPNLLNLAGTALVWLGVQRFARGPHSMGLAIGSALLLVVVVGWALLGRSSLTPLMVVVMSVGMSVYLGLSAWALLSRLGGPLSRYSSIFLALPMATAAVALAVRAAMALPVHSPVAGGITSPEVPNQVLLALYVVLSLLINVSLWGALITRMVMKLTHQSTHDMLTGMLNRRGFEDALKHERQRQLRHGSSFAVLLADVDHFKRINDTHGHAVGDAALRSVSARLREQMRGLDRIGRVGGEEFAILLPDTPEQDAMVLAERLLEAVRATPHDAGGEWLSITISIGVTPMRRVDEHPGVAWRRADAALYEAKASGRDRVVLHSA